MNCSIYFTICNFVIFVFERALRLPSASADQSGARTSYPSRSRLVADWFFTGELLALIGRQIEACPFCTNVTKTKEKYYFIAKRKMVFYGKASVIKTKSKFLTFLQKIRDIEVAIHQ